MNTDALTTNIKLLEAELEALRELNRASISEDRPLQYSWATYLIREQIQRYKKLSDPNIPDYQDEP